MSALDIGVIWLLVFGGFSCRGDVGVFIPAVFCRVSCAVIYLLGFAGFAVFLVVGLDGNCDCIRSSVCVSLAKSLFFEGFHHLGVGVFEFGAFLLQVFHGVFHVCLPIGC